MYHAEVDHQGRLRIAVRHQPSGPLRVHRPAARPRAGRAGFTRGDGQQHRPSLRPRHPLRRPAVGARATAGSRAYGQSKLANLLFTYELQRRLAGHQHHRRRRASRRLEHRTDAQPAAAVAGRATLLAAAVPGRRHGRAADAARGHRSRRARRAVLRTRRVRPNSAATRRWWRPADAPTTPTRSAGCGRSPRS